MFHPHRWRGWHEFPRSAWELGDSYHHYLFKQDLQRLANEIGMEIRVAHYPAYCSKYNPIEHCLFPHVTRACQGVVFTNIERVKKNNEPFDNTRFYAISTSAG
ncbi:MAG: hypothetical protein PHY54_18215 [Methylococcales bacterium]|nr:hypothetical protein [Methylococcales bacterium]